MRILFVASLHHPEALRDAPPFPDGTRPLFPPSMSQYFWEKALRQRGHTVDVFWRNQPVIGLPERRTARHSERITPGKLIRAGLNRIPPHFNPDLRLRNRRLLERAEAFRPDVLWMVGDNTVIYPETLAAIKAATGCQIVYACGTSPIVFSHPIDRAAARLYDLVLASDYYHGIQWLELGAQRMVALPLAACDPDFHRPYPLTDAERAEVGCEIAFVGTLVPAHLYSRRVRALEALRAFDLGIWSVHDVPASLRPFVRGRALGAEMQRLLSAGKLCFNTHGDFVYYGGNLRLFEVAGAGVMQIVDDLPGVREWFPSPPDAPMVITYRDLDELRAQVRWWLDHDAEREAAAARAREHVYAHHTYAKRVEQFERLIG
ncbi:MAG: glycosyltransferase family protein [Candidatus Flexifilum sp.]|jgi:glycosyltransferase involved in cell wall biosynthesis